MRASTIQSLDSHVKSFAVPSSPPSFSSDCQPQLCKNASGVTFSQFQLHFSRKDSFKTFRNQESRIRFEFVILWKLTDSLKILSVATTKMIKANDEEWSKDKMEDCIQSKSFSTWFSWNTFLGLFVQLFRNEVKTRLGTILLNFGPVCSAVHSTPSEGNNSVYSHFRFSCTPACRKYQSLATSFNISRVVPFYHLGHFYDSLTNTHFLSLQFMVVNLGFS